MKKIFLKSFLILSITLSFMTSIYAKVVDDELVYIINLYKQGNVVESYQQVLKYLDKDPSNALAHYYKAISSVKLGKQDEAMDSYNAVLNLSNDIFLKKYATKGLACLNGEEGCDEVVDINKLNNNVELKKMFPYDSTFSRDALKQHEKMKLESIKNEINGKSDIDFDKLKQFKNYSSELPTDDEIKMAVQVFNKLGYDINNILNLKNGNIAYDLLNTSNNLSVENLQFLLQQNLPMEF